MMKSEILSNTITYEKLGVGFKAPLIHTEKRKKQTPQNTGEELKGLSTK